ncbi:MAG: nascent polypeptide-associated complex protein [Nanoarchaeota archaeon]
MFPGMNMNPRQMKMAMQKMGIKQEELEAVKVTVELKDKRLVFDSPQVSKVNMMGNDTYQIVGEPVEEELDSSPEIDEEDVKTVMEQTGVSEEKALKSIQDNDGDLAKAIMDLQE